MRKQSTRQKKLSFAVASLTCLCFTCYITISTVGKYNTSCRNSEKIHLFSNRALKAFRSYDNKANQLKGGGIDPQAELNLSQLNRNDYFTCEDLAKVPQASQSVKESVGGNKGITFLRISIGERVIDVVYKEASKFLDTIGDAYKYYSALREIEYLSKLRGLPGIPYLFGSCIKENYAAYLVERVNGRTICRGNGTTINCADGVFILEAIASFSDPKLAALQVAFTTARLFKILEERHLFFEDLTGINLMLSKNFEVILVDADSLIFYNTTRLYSGFKCENNMHCRGPTGNLWDPSSLNAKIYKPCLDFKGICDNMKCRGFDNSLHSCGVAQWYLCRLEKFFVKIPGIRSEFEKVCSCLRVSDPVNRCSFKYAVEVYENLMVSYLELLREKRSKLY